MEGIKGGGKTSRTFIFLGGEGGGALVARREIKDRLVRLDFTLYRMRILEREHTVSTVGLARRPSQLPSSDDVEVEVVHRLAATGAVIDGDPEALAEPLVLVSRKSR